MRVSCRAGIFGAAGCCSMLIAQGVAAQPAPVTELVWSAPAACPAREAVVAHVERYLGGPIAQPRKQILQILVSVVEQPEGLFSAQIDVSGGPDTPPRVLENGDCHKLAEGVALIAALAIDPEAAAASGGVADDVNADPSPVTAPDAPPSPPVLEPAPSRRAEARSTPPPPASRPWRWSLGAVGLVGAGELPSIGPGVGARFGVGADRWRVAASAHYWLPRFAEWAESPKVGVELSLIAASLKICGLQGFGRLWLAGCVGPEVGNLTGTGVGLDGGKTADDRWSSLQVDISLHWPFRSWVGGLLGVELGRALETPSFGFRLNGRQQELFESSPWNVRIFLGFELF